MAHQLLAALFAATLALGCSSGSFSGSAGKKSQDQGGRKNGPKPAADADAKTNGTTGAENALATDANGFEPICPESEQTILILDLKSGWWAGDGGNFFNLMLGGLTGSCGKKVRIEYHHVLDGMQIGATFPNAQGSVPVPTGSAGGASEDDEGAVDMSETTDMGVPLPTDLSGYQQIWLLSGAVDDPADLRLDAPVFRGLVDGLADSKASLFIGAGYGSRSHANAALERIGLGAMIGTELTEGLILSPEGTLAIKSRLESVAKDHPLLDRVDQVADVLDIEGETAAGDFLQSPGSATIIANNAKGQPVLAEARASGRKVVIDTGLQRYYAVGKDQATRRLIQNILSYLGK